MHNRRAGMIALLFVALLAPPLLSGAQPAGKGARVGWVGSGRTGPFEAFRDGMRERGWVEGQNLTLEARVGELAQAPHLMAEVQRAKVDVIVTEGPMVLRARTGAGATPLVFGFSGDPVEARLVANLARPGGTMTGVTAMSWDLIGKRLQLLKEALPGLARVAVVANPAHPGEQSELRVSQEAARELDVALQYLPVRAPGDFEAAFGAMVRERAQAAIVFPDAFMNRNAKAIADLAARHRIPVVSGVREFAEAGNFMTYGPSLTEFWRHVSQYVDKILKGARPADLPVEQPTTFELVINLRTARALGLSVPPSLLVRADRILE
jgi:putative ABC transport system substrate-binding protein